MVMQGLLPIDKNQLFLITGAKPDGLSGLIPDHIRRRNGFFRHFETVHREGRQDRFSVLAGGHIGVKAGVDTLDLKDGAGVTVFSSLPSRFQMVRLGRRWSLAVTLTVPPPSTVA